jgi:FkbM family methyltransferase
MIYYYSQCGEDIFLNENIFKNYRNGTYIELGALDGVLYSNTKLFEDTLGWSGILIEPHPEKFKLLTENRPNNFLFNNLVSCNKEPLDFRYFLDNHAAVSGVENTLPNTHFDTYFENEQYKNLLQNVIKITPVSLTEIIKQTKISHIDLLSLDVEGHELEVLQSWDFSVPINVILIEMLGEVKEKEDECRKILINNGYVLYSIVAHNEVYILKNLINHL